MGLRRAKAQAQREMNDMADRFEDTLGQIHAEMRGVRDELARLRRLVTRLVRRRLILGTGA